MENDNKENDEKIDPSYFSAEEMLTLTQNGYDKMADDWSSTRQTFWPELTDKIQRYVFGNHDDNIKLLDVGCGNGRLLSIIPKDKIDYLGVDVSKELLFIAKKNNPDFNFALVDPMMDSLSNFEDGEFERIVSIGVLHHIPPNVVENWLANIYRVTADDSFSVFTVWNLSGTYYELNSDGDTVINFMHHKNSRYLHDYTKEELTDLFSKVGYEIIEISEIMRESGSGMSNILLIVKKSYDYEM